MPPAQIPEPERPAPAPAEPDPAREQLKREAIEGDDTAAELMAVAMGAEVDSERPYGRLGRPLAHSSFSFGFKAALGAILAIIVWRGLASITGTLVLIVMALFLAVGLNPFVERLEARGLSRRASVGLVFIGVLLIFIVAAAAIVPAVYTQVTDLVKALPTYIKSIQDNEIVQRLDRDYGVLDKARQKLTSADLSTAVANRALGAAGSLLGGVFQTLTLMILTLYFLSSLHGIKALAYRLVPLTRRPRVILLGDEILLRTGGYISGALAISAIAGASAFLFMEIAGVHFALPLAIAVAVTDLIPMVGATIGALIGVVFALTQSLWLGLATLIFFTIYQQLENYLIYPRIMKRAVNVHPAAAVVAALVGGTLMGFAGALLAIPTAAAIQLLLEEVVYPRQDSA